MYPYSRIVTLLNPCGKLLLARSAKMGKSLQEVAAFAKSLLNGAGNVYKKGRYQ